MPCNRLGAHPRMQTSVLLLSLLALMQVTLTVPCPAENAAKLSASELTALVRSPSTHAKTADATVIGTGPMVKVIAMKDGTATEADMKVDAIFLAKALIDGAEGQVTSVEVLFMQEGRDDRFVVI